MDRRKITFGLQSYLSFRTLISLLIFAFIFISHNTFAYQEHLDLRLGAYDYGRELQSSTTCNSNQYLNSSNKCNDCNAACATCVAPSGSCEKCVYTLPNIAYPQVIGNALASCGGNLKGCFYRDPFCLGECGNTQNGGKCQICLKGSSITPILDSGINSNVYSCLKCQVQYCTNCFLNTTGGNEVPTCTECERNFALLNDNSAGTLIQRCVRSSSYCPPFCICDYGGSMNCTSCNETSYMLIKETGISDYSRCVKNDTVNPNLDCGPNCNICNSVTGICMECMSGYQPAYDASLITPQSKYICQLPCGDGCLNCNHVTRSCSQCDEYSNYTLFLRDQTTKTYRCHDITHMCDQYCVNCDKSGLQLYPPVLSGTCQECRRGYYVTTQKNCMQCPSLCSDCAKNTGSCSACTNIRYTLYQDTTQNINLCTDKTCHNACLLCDIQEGMNSLSRRPNCKRCSQGYYMTSDYDCKLCPLNCGSCDDITGKCNMCQPGFSLYFEGEGVSETTRCISDSTVGVCTVPHCSTCDATSNTTCVICDPGYTLNTIDNTCPCAITLAFKGRYFTQDWQQIQIIWSGRVEGLANIDPADTIAFCSQVLSTQTQININQGITPHQCAFSYDLSTQRTTFTIKLNPLWTIPVDDTASRTPTIQLSFNLTKLRTPNCQASLDPAHFTSISLSGGDPSTPVIVLSRTLSEIPLCTPYLRLSAGLTQGLFNRPASFFWSLLSMFPVEQSTTKQTALLNNLNADTAGSDEMLDSELIKLLAGKTINLRLTVINFLGKSRYQQFEFKFLETEGIYLRDIMEEYVINPQTAFKFTPKTVLSNCNFTATSIVRIQRLQIKCTIQVRDPVTTQYSDVAVIQQCTIPSGMMRYGTQYRVEFIGYDPMKEYSINATKYSLIKLVKPPIIAKIIGGDQTIDSNKDLTLSVRGENLSKDLSYKWQCKDPVTGLQCVDLYGFYLFLQGTESVFIKKNILAAGTTYQILFTAADQLDVSRVATDFITVTTLPQQTKLLLVTIYSDANMNNNQLNVFEKQVFRATVLNSASNPIPNMSGYTFTWTIKDSMDRPFIQFQSFMSTMTIERNMLMPNNVYQVCISVTNANTYENGMSCSKYKSYGDSNLFSFKVSPSIGSAYSTNFVFTCSNNQLLNQQYYFEYGYMQLTFNSMSLAILDQTYVPFESASSSMVKSFKLQPAQPGQTNIVKTYAKVTSEIGERYIYFKDVTVTLPTQNATWVGDTITQVNFDNLNEVFTKVSQVSYTYEAIETKYKPTVIRTLVSGIANITNFTFGLSKVQSTHSRLLQAGMGIGSMQDDTVIQRLTLARSLSQVTELIRRDPEIITSKEKDQLKGILQTMIGLEGDDNEFFSSQSLEFELQTTPKNSNPIISNAGETKNKNLSTDSSQTPLLTDNVMVKDDGARGTQKVVEKYNPSLASELMKICDDLYRGESLSNRTDPELKNVALIGMKKVMSGSMDDITNTFTYESSFVKAYSYSIITGRDSTINKVYTIEDPNFATNMIVNLPNQDLCKGKSCQLTLLALSDPPITRLGVKLVGSTLSIAFQKSDILNQNTQQVEPLDINNLDNPIYIRMTLDPRALNSSALKRCTFFDTKLNAMNDYGVISRYNSSTYSIQCEAFHLTDFSVEEYDPLTKTSTMPPNFNRVDIFTPLQLSKTTPVAIIIILAVTILILIPISLVLDRFGEKALKQQQAAFEKPKLLTDKLFFNKYQERNKKEYQIAKADENQEEEKKEEEEASKEEPSQDPDEEFEDPDVLNWKRKKEREERERQEELKRLAKARGNYSLLLMLLLALRYQHRVIQLFIAFDEGLSRLSRSFILIASLFVNLLVTGFYCRVESGSNSSASLMACIIALLLQKFILIILNLLMVKKPKLKRVKINDDELGLQKPNAKKDDHHKVKEREFISYKFSPCDKMSLSIGYFIIFSVILGTIYFCLMQSQRIDSDDNAQWAGSFVLLLFLDFVIFELVSITLSTLLLKKVGSHPLALGRLRNLVIKIGPRAIRFAVVEEVVKQQKKKKQIQTIQKKVPKDREIKREKQKQRQVDAR